MDAEIFSLADKVIEILKTRKVTDLKQLIAETGGREKDVRKIVDLLEQQGLANVEYKLTRIVINWIDAGNVSSPLISSRKISFTSHPAAKETTRAALQPDSRAGAAPLASSRYKVRLQIDRPEGQETAERAAADAPTDESLLLPSEMPRSSLIDFGLGRKEHVSGGQRVSKKYATLEGPKQDKEPVEEKRTQKDERRERSEKQKSAAEARLLNQEEKIRKEVEAEVKDIERKLKSKLGTKKEAVKPDFDQTDLVRSVINERSSKRAKRSQGDRAVLRKYLSAPANVATAARVTPAVDRADEYMEAFSIDVSGSDDSDSDEERLQSVSGELRARMDSIREKKVEVATLSRQKAGMLDESYAPLESRLSAELTIISEVVSEREKRLKSLRERLKALPEDIGSLEVESMELKNAEAEAKGRFDGVLNDLKTLAKDIKSLRSSTQGEIVDVKKSIRQQESELRDLRELHAKYKGKEADIEGAISGVRNKIERETMELNGLESKLLEIHGASSVIEQRLGGVESKLSDGAEYSGVASGFVGRLRDLEDEITSVHTAYSDARSRLLEDIDRYDRELLTLRESIEAGFARKYLVEIERLAEKHDAEIMAVAEREREIDDRLASKREELKSLIHEARQLQDRMHSMLPRRQIKTIDELRRDISLGSEPTRAQEEPAGGKPEDSAVRRNMVDSLTDIFSKLKKE